MQKGLDIRAIPEKYTVSLMFSVIAEKNSHSLSQFFSIGIGSSLTIVKSLCIAANFVGTNTEDAAFMYGIITFFDKIINGIIILFVEYV